MSKQHKPHKPQQPARQPIDPILAKRLDQLNSRRPGSPLPPPSPSQAAPQRAARVAAPAGGPSTAATAEQQRRLAAVAARSQAARTGAAPAGAKRNKPAKGAKVASLALSVVTAAGLAAMFANNEGTTDSVILTGGTVQPGTGATTATTAAPVVAGDDDTASTAATVPATAAPTTVAAAPGTILDGTYVGGASQNRWGVVQVQAVYSGGQLVDVQILSYPDGDNKSIRINQRALPSLISESINAQSADISGVSGATYTSRSYVASLQSAIDSAKAASGVAG